MKALNLEGQKYGRLTAITRVKGEGSKWECRCDCGKVKIIATGKLRHGTTLSCGCLRGEIHGQRGRQQLTKHGHSKTGNGLPTREYYTWMSMKNRCLNPKHEHYKRYGGRGIKICDRWLGNFDLFLKDMGVRPQGKYLDRIDPDGDYSPQNCRWATMLEQNRNRSHHKLIEPEKVKA